MSNTQIHDPIEGKSGSTQIRKILQPIVVLCYLKGSSSYEVTLCAKPHYGREGCSEASRDVKFCYLPARNRVYKLFL